MSGITDILLLNRLILTSPERLVNPPNEVILLF